MLALIYGGSGSGKSHFAENLLCTSDSGPRHYVATMHPGDAEARERIAKHRAERAHKGFVTVERYTNLEGLDLPAGSRVLLECLGNLVANELFAPDGAGAATRDAVLRGLERLRERAVDLVVVSNDVFSDGVEYPAETREYCRILASLHRSLAPCCDIVVETVCGIPLFVKGSENAS